MTSININAERIYITAEQIYISAIALYISRLAIFMFMHVIFIFCFSIYFSTVNRINFTSINFAGLFGSRTLAFSILKF